MKQLPFYLNCLAFQMGVAKRKIHEYYEERLAPYGLTPTYMYVLGIVYDQGPSTLTSIASILQLEKASVSTLLHRMERDGFLERKPGKERRSLSVSLTEKGVRVLEKAILTMQEADRELNKQLGGELENIKQAVIQVNLTVT